MEKEHISTVSEQKKMNQRIVNLRALAIIIVVMGHSIILYSSSWNLYDTAYKVPLLDSIKDMINVIQMPLFFSISGYLMYYSKLNNLQRFFKGKLKRIILPYLAVGCLYMIPIKLLIGMKNYVSRGYIKSLLCLLIGHDSSHLWYLYSLFIMFVVMFPIIKLLRESNRAWWMLVAFLFFLLAIFKWDYGQAYLQGVKKYLLFFYLGACINRIEGKEKFTKITKHKGLISMVLLIISLFAAVKFCSDIYLVESVKITLIQLFIVWLAYFGISEKHNKVLDIISQDSFGIYLLHSPLIYITYTYFANSSPFVVVGLNIIFAVFSLLLTELIKKTPAKILIGE